MPSRTYWPDLFGGKTWYESAAAGGDIPAPSLASGSEPRQHTPVHRTHAGTGQAHGAYGRTR